MLKRLNAYTFTSQWIDAGRKFILSGRRQYPHHLIYPSDREEFRTRYVGFEVDKDGNLIYDDNDTLRHVIVVPIEQIDSVLAQLYKSLGDIGRDRFYALIKQRYIGISRRDVYKFLSNQETHQLVQPVHRQINKPIVASKPLERLQVDLIDLSQYKSPQNRHTSYLLTIIDCFSKYAWAIPLTNKSSENVAKAFKKILTTEELPSIPSIVQSDNGSEFAGEFSYLLNDYNIKHIKSLPYSPQSNGQIERLNQTLKRMIRTYMISNQTRSYIEHLPTLLSLYNSIPHTTTGYPPKHLLDSSSSNDITSNALSSIQRKALKKVKLSQSKSHHPPLDIGDTVRVANIHRPGGAGVGTYHWSK